MEIAFLIGRIIVGVYYLFNAASHFMQLEMMSGYAGSKGVPAPKSAVAGSGPAALDRRLEYFARLSAPHWRDCPRTILVAGHLHDAQLLGHRGPTNENERYGKFHEEHGLARFRTDVPGHPHPLAIQPGWLMAGSFQNVSYFSATDGMDFHRLPGFFRENLCNPWQKQKNARVQYRRKEHKSWQK